MRVPTMVPRKRPKEQRWQARCALWERVSFQCRSSVVPASFQWECSNLPFRDPLPLHFLLTQGRISASCLVVACAKVPASIANLANRVWPQRAAAVATPAAALPGDNPPPLPSLPSLPSQRALGPEIGAYIRTRTTGLIPQDPDSDSPA